MTLDLCMAMVKRRIADIDAESLVLVSEARKLKRDAVLAKARAEGKPRTAFIWSRWTGKVRRMVG